MDKPYEVYAGYDNYVWAKCGELDRFGDYLEEIELTPDQARAMAAELIAAADKTEGR